jgi:hypothetical protein
MLPSLEVIDGLIGYYFEYCNWIYRHVNQTTFTHQWQRFKTGSSADRIVLATACAIMAVATHYLPLQHHLLEGFQETHEAMGHKFFEVSTMSLQRRQAETKVYNLELVELMLIRCHYLTLLKTDSEDIWYVKGELVTIGTAMGLHRDPGKWRMHRDTAERRRWAWWHIILLERYLNFKTLNVPRLTEIVFTDGKRSCSADQSQFYHITSTHSFHHTVTQLRISQGVYTSQTWPCFV